MHEHIIKTGTELAHLHMFQQVWPTGVVFRGVAMPLILLTSAIQISPPLFEYRQLFERALGAGSDVVHKEMLGFGEFALRPEGTAGVVRAVLHNKRLMYQLPQRFFYHGPMFRDEKSQRGRLRQFHQFGLEVIGLDSTAADAELIAVGAALLQRLGIDAELRINSLGEETALARYRSVLSDFFYHRRDGLCEASRARLDRGHVLRILDSSDPADQPVLSEVPPIEKYLHPLAKARFEAVLASLDALKVPFTRDNRLVRGLDYYSHTVFEFVARGASVDAALGPQQRTVLAGGCYDLVLQLGGKSTPSVGWAAGIERLASLVRWTPPSPHRPVAVVQVRPAGMAASAASAVENAALQVAQALRLGLGLRVVSWPSGLSVSKQMSNARELQARWAIIVGEDELAAGRYQVKDFDSQQQESVPVGELQAFFAQRRA